MKLCSKCKIEKPKSEFYRDKSSKDGLSYTCKSCVSERGKKWRETNRNRVQEYRKEYLLKNELAVREQILNKTKKAMLFVQSLKKPCVKCGENRPWVIQFHHIDPSTKKFTIGSGHTYSKDSLREEALKCVCLCSNCHDEFHYFFGKSPKHPKEDLELYLEGRNYEETDSGATAHCDSSGLWSKTERTCGCHTNTDYFQ